MFLRHLKSFIFTNKKYKKRQIDLIYSNLVCFYLLIRIFLFLLSKTKIKKKNKAKIKKKQTIDNDQDM